MTQIGNDINITPFLSLKKYFGHHRIIIFIYLLLISMKTTFDLIVYSYYFYGKNLFQFNAISQSDKDM